MQLIVGIQHRPLFFAEQRRLGADDPSQGCPARMDIVHIYIYIGMYVYVCVYIHVYIYIYIYHLISYTYTLCVYI